MIDMVGIVVEIWFWRLRTLLMLWRFWRGNFGIARIRGCNCGCYCGCDMILELQRP